MRWAVIVILLLAYPVVVFVIAKCSPRPEGVQLEVGLPSPNWVSTYARDPQHHMDPLPFAGTASAAKARLKDAMTELGRSELVADEGPYLHFECRTLVLRFVDDVEFFIDEGHHVVYFRSASRLGYSDFGVNRRRMEQVRVLFTRATR